jgi:hypothetical protein
MSPHFSDFKTPQRIYATSLGSLPVYDVYDYNITHIKHLA